jgi:hypothetical protein
MIAAERRARLDLRDRGEIDDEAWQHIEHNVDLEQLHMAERRIRQRRGICATPREAVWSALSR